MAARDGHVHVLPLHVANKIAAGEVVERPASVVKELVENSVDAGAANIKVSIAQGGRKLVSVRDDGCGMAKDDALLSLERQATSKILDVDDIENIDTLGFRGEAIPSIASVSRFTLVTRRHDADEGTQIVVNAGELVETSAAGCPPGTLVEVRDLFCNVPARRKFLRSSATEEGRVKGIFTVHALAHPGIGFSLTVDGRELYRLAPAASLADRLFDVYGAEFIESLIALPTPPEAQANAVRVWGYIEKPNLSMPTRHEQYVFVNGRPATAPSIAYAVREAYPHRQGDVKPALFLFIELPPNQVDVNVHPTKREVRFRDNNAVKRAITEAIEGALGLRATERDEATSGETTSEATTIETNGAKTPLHPPPPSPTPPLLNSASNSNSNRASTRSRRHDGETVEVVQVPRRDRERLSSRGDRCGTRHHKPARSPRAHRLRAAPLALRPRRSPFSAASHSRNDSPLARRRRADNGRARRHRADGIQDRALRPRHIQDRRRSADNRLPLPRGSGLDDCARPLRRRREARRTLARGSCREVGGEIVRRDVACARRDGGDKACRRARIVQDAVCKPRREADDDIHVDERARQKVREELNVPPFAAVTGGEEI